jgi:hypothetical protein
MNAQNIENPILDHEVDDLLLRARGLVLVRELLSTRGASRGELEAHTEELERVRGQLIETIGGRS